jgi:uncharacterized protein YbjT (DUF2867 family)
MRILIAGASGAIGRPLVRRKPVTSARRAPDNADFVRIKTYLSLGFSAYS